MWGFIGIFVLCCGVYALYSFVMMKVKGEVNASILLGKDYTYKKCKDKEAYIAKTAPASSAAIKILGRRIFHIILYSVAAPSFRKRIRRKFFRSCTGI